MPAHAEMSVAEVTFCMAARLACRSMLFDASMPETTAAAASATARVSGLIVDGAIAAIASQRAW